IAMNNLASVTARIGWKGFNPNFLPYIKGGWYSARENLIQNTCLYSSRSNFTAHGWGICGGFAAVIYGPWAFFVYYQRFQLKKNGQDWGFTSGGAYTVNIKQKLDIIKLGLNYKFSSWGR